MWAVYSLLGLLALIVVLVLAVLFVPVSGRVAYDGEFRLKIRVLGIPITLAPSDKKERKKPKKAKSKRKASSPKEAKPSKWQEIKELLKQDSLGSTLSFLKEVAGLAGRTANRALRAITIREMRLHLLVASEDAATTAQRYGQVCGLVYPTVALIEQKVCVRRREVRVEPNFLLEQGAARFDVRFRIKIWRLLGAGFTLLWGVLTLREKEYPQNTKEVS